MRNNVIIFFKQVLFLLFLELLPGSFYKRERQIAPFEIVGYISEINTFNTILTSFGFPENYQSGRLYKWIVHYSGSHFVKLVFTHLDLNTVKVNILQIIQ